MLTFCVNSALFTGPTNITFQQFFIKNKFHSTIHTFENYFVIIFLVFNSIKTDPKYNIEIKYIEAKVKILKAKVKQNLGSAEPDHVGGSHPHNLNYGPHSHSSSSSSSSLSSAFTFQFQIQTS